MNRLPTSVFRSGLFRGKVAIVTGGATGIGKAITQELLYLGCNVVIASRNEDNLAGAVKDLQSTLPKDRVSSISYVPCNIRKEDNVQNLVSQTLQTHKKLDFLVNNGGGQFFCPAADISLKGWDAVVETNLTGTFLMCKEAYNQWMKHYGGCIVNIVMENARGYPLAAHSGAARAGIDNLVRTLAVEWASSGVRINAVAPGCIYSETAADNYAKGVFDQVRPRLPSKRAGIPEEISSVVCFLLSPGASYVSGTTVVADAASHLYPALTYEIPEHERWPQHDSREDGLDKK